MTDPRIAIVREWFADTTFRSLRDESALELLSRLDALAPKGEERADLPESGFADVRCSTCDHAPESHHAGTGQCYTCEAGRRCVRYGVRDERLKGGG